MAKANAARSMQRNAITWNLIWNKPKRVAIKEEGGLQAPYTAYSRLNQKRE